MLTAINKVASPQAKPTVTVERAAFRLLQYAKKYPNASIQYKASEMVLYGHSDASYLSESQARSRAGGILFLGNNRDDGQKGCATNGAIECSSSIISSVVASAAEAEYGALFLLGQTAEGIRSTLEDLGYPQPPTQIFSDNKCAVGIANGKMKQKRSKAFDMRFHWIGDRVKQHHFVITWAPGKTNLADILTKALSVKQHSEIRKLYVHDITQVSS
jgi:hypothetical protein